jgi:hypothetical protein
MKKSAAICSAFLMAAGLAAAQEKTPRALVDYIKSGGHMGMPASGDVRDYERDPNAESVSLDYELNAILAEDGQGKLMRCLWLKIVPDKNANISLSDFNKLGVYKIMSPEAADVLRPDSANNGNYLSFGSCVPYETPVPSAIVERLRKGYEDAFSPLEHTSFGANDKNGEEVFRAMAVILGDPVREARFAAKKRNIVTLTGKPCANTGYREGKPEDLKLRVCPNP